MRIPPHETHEVPEGPWWWACARPEAPGDVWTLYAQDDCRACAIALLAHVKAQPSVVLEIRKATTGELLTERTAAEVAAYLEGPPL